MLLVLTLGDINSQSCNKEIIVPVEMFQRHEDQDVGSRDPENCSAFQSFLLEQLWSCTLNQFSIVKPHLKIVQKVKYKSQRF